MKLIDEVRAIIADIQLGRAHRKVKRLREDLHGDVRMLRSKRDPVEVAWWALIVSATQSALMDAERRLHRMHAARGPQWQPDTRQGGRHGSQAH